MKDVMALGPDLCQRLRDTTDAIVGPIGERSTSVELEGEGRHLIDPHNSEVFDIDHALATHRSVVGSSNYRHGIRHPIFGPDPACLAEAALAGNMVEMQKKLLRSGDGLRLMQQQLVRSDPDPKATPDARQGEADAALEAAITGQTIGAVKEAAAEKNSEAD